MSNRSTETKHRLGLAAIAAGCCALLFLAYALPDLLSASQFVRAQFDPDQFPTLRAYQHAELRTTDLLQVYGRKATPAPDLVFLGIDMPCFEQSDLLGNEREHPALQMMGATVPGQPFPRAIYAMVIERLAEAGAKSVALDVQFPTVKEGDERFRVALERYEKVAVIGCNIQVGDDGTAGSVHVVPPAASLIAVPNNEYDRRVGFINFKPDADGIVRRIDYRTNVREYLPMAGDEGVRDDSLPELLPLSARAASQAGLGSLIPPQRTPVMFRFLINPPEHSLRDIFVPDLWVKTLQNGEYFRNKIVLIGPSGNWSKDELPTPFGQMLGPKIHLSALNALLTQDFLRSSSQWMDVLLLVIAGVAAMISGFRIADPLARSAVLLALAGAYIGVAFLLYNFNGFVLNLLGPNLALLSSGFIGLVWERVLERQEKARVRQTLERYVSKDVVSEVLDNPESFLNTVGGMRKPITILFSDIRDFTTLTETADATKLVLQLNEYFTEMVRVVFANRGTLDKFIGDAVMAHWGSIVSRGTSADACRAVAAGLHMRQVLPKLNARWKAQGMTELRIGIGVNHGDAICGHIGSDEKHEVTAIGDSVNLAARLESATKEFRQDFLIGEQVAPLVSGQFILRSVELLRVKGKTRPVQVFAVLGDRNEMKEPEWLAAHEEGMRLYRERSFLAAGEKFEEVVTATPNDWLAGEYAERCREFVEEAPPLDWDGSYVMTRK